MKRFIGIALFAWSLVVVGLCTDTEAARGCRPTRRQCAGVTHQPCAPAALRAPRAQTSVTETVECVCAFWMFYQGPGYNGYYAGDFYPDCNTASWVGLYGYYTTSNPDPCATCPSDQCLSYIHTSATTPGGPHFKPGTKLERLLKWDEKFVLKSGTGKFKRADGTERVVEFEAKELTEAKMLVSFTKGNTQYFAKLHSCRLESQEIGGKKAATVVDIGLGQEIEAPPAGQKIHDISNQVTIVGPNVAQVRIGNSVYQLVTLTPLAE